MREQLFQTDNVPLSGEYRGLSEAGRVFMQHLKLDEDVTMLVVRSEEVPFRSGKDAFGRKWVEAIQWADNKGIFTRWCLSGYPDENRGSWMSED